MDENEIKQRAKNFLANESKASLATVCEGKPWVVDSFYISDKEGNLYFLVSRESKTVYNLIANENVAVSIEQNSEQGNKFKNIQLTGTAKIIRGKELKEVIDTYEIKFPGLIGENFTQKDFEGSSAKEGFLKFEPKKVYFQDTDAFEGKIEVLL